MEKSQLQLQEQRELEMHNLGIKNLQRALSEAENRLYASHTFYGLKATKAVLPELVKKLSSELRKRVKGQTGESAAVLSKHLQGVRAEPLIYITLMTLFDCAGVRKKYSKIGDNSDREETRKTEAQVQNILYKRLESEAIFQKFKKASKGSWRSLSKQVFTEHVGTQQKVGNMFRAMNRRAAFFQDVLDGKKQPDWYLELEGDARQNMDKAMTEVTDLMNKPRWSEGDGLAISTWFITRMKQYLVGWFSTERPGFDGSKEVAYIVFGTEFLKQRHRLIEQAKRFSFFNLPMLCEPTDWGADQYGGYLMNELNHHHNFVRGYGEKSEISQVTYDFVNRQQRVAFCVNPFVLDVQRWMRKKGFTIDHDSFKVYLAPEKGDIPVLPANLKLPVKIQDHHQGKERLDLLEKKKKRRRELDRIRDFHTRQVALQEVTIPTSRYFQTMDIIEKDERFYFPWSVCSRTRCYPLTDSFSPQGPEYQKAVLSYADPTPLDDRSEHWMKVMLATAAGYGKESFDSREAIGQRLINSGQIKAVATDPKGAGYQVWTQMDEPWIFLATAKEIWDCFLKPGKRKEETNLYCTGVDGTASGLQILGGLTKDKQTCQLVNCVPADKPSDVYKAVLDKTIELIQADEYQPSVLPSPFPVEKIAGKRKLTKLSCMTKAYAAGHDTRVFQVAQTLSEIGLILYPSVDKGVSLKAVNEAAVNYLVTKIEDAMTLLIPGADKILEWFLLVSRHIYEAGGSLIRIPTASGNVIVHDYRFPKFSIKYTMAYGSYAGTSKKRRKLADGFEDDVDIEAGIRALGANLTHSCDSAILQLALHDYEGSNFGTNHDAVYLPCSRQIDCVQKRLQKAYVDVVVHNCLEQLLVENGLESEELKVPMKNTYNPEDGLNATYLFC